VEYRLVSADSHVNEAPDLWESRLPSRLRERGPRLVRGDDGQDVWVAEGIGPMPLVWATNAAGQRPPDGPFEDHEMTISREEMVTGSYDPKARLTDMDADGVDAEVLYPGPFGGLGGGGGVAGLRDTELRTASIRAYNDWLSEFCAEAPERLVGLALIRLEEPDFAEAEIERSAALGLRGGVINAMPDMSGAPPIFSPTYERVWAKAEEARFPLSLHIGQTRSLSPLVEAAGRDGDQSTGSDDGGGNPLGTSGSGTGIAEMFFTMMCLDMAEPVSLLIFSGVLERHPGMRFAIAESGIGWIPFVLERMDYTFDRHRLWMKSGIGRRPSEYFHECFAATFQQDDETGLLARHIAGVGNLMWASDYPHTDSTWPYSRSVVDKLFHDVPEADRHQIVAANAVRFYGLDG
jgi:predicted TIM-barrel fold metal-dependent hydrolase